MSNKKEGKHWPKSKWAKPISEEEYTPTKVLTVFSMCLLGVLVLMILERLLNYVKYGHGRVPDDQDPAGIGIVGAPGHLAAGTRAFRQTPGARRLICGRNADCEHCDHPSMSVINYLGIQPIKVLYGEAWCWRYIILVYHSYAPEFFLIAVDSGVALD